jgi:hypothetical protein
MSKQVLNDEFGQVPAFAPTVEQLRRIEQRARFERAKASREAAHYVARKIKNFLVGERAADKVRIDTAA